MSGLIEEIAKEGRVPLELYGHQVGGHHMLFKYKDKVCKPVIPREHFFYQTAPEVVTRYIPTYHGVVDVSYMHRSSGEIEVVAFPKPQPTPVPPYLQEKKSIIVQGKEFPRLSIPKCTTGNTIHSNGTALKSGYTVTNGEGYTNPWAIKCRQNMDEKLKELEGHLDSFTNDYMILENLTAKYRCPCVLDLKVGTRQHGDDAPAYKVQRHIITCSLSTSRSLGVRMAGMQKYNALKNEYVFFDKYFGKQLTEEELQQVILSFFDNGICLRSDIFPTLVKMLADLKASIKALPTFRYFSSSLLIIYDGGAEWPLDLPPAAGLVRRNFDSILLRTQRAKSPEIDSSAENTQEHTTMTTEVPRTNPEPSRLLEPEAGVSLTPPTSGGEGLMSAEELSQARRVVDVRMIDFAHSTHSCYYDKISYKGFDEGYLRGMSTLVDIFEGMQRNYCQNGCGL